MSGYAVDDVFALPREAFARAEGWLAGPEAAGLGHAAIEEELAARGREIERLLWQAHLDLRAAREQRLAQVRGPDGIARTRAETGHGRALSSVFGPVQVSRIAYRAPGVPNVHPADAVLDLPRDRYSHGLAKMTAAAVAAGSFGQACAQVAARTGCTLGTRQAQQVTRHAACDFGGFYARHRPPPGAAPSQVLALSCDAKGIAVRPGQLRPQTVRKLRSPCRSRTGGCPAAKSAPISGWPRPARSSGSARRRARPRTSWTPVPAGQGRGSPASG